MPVYFVGFGDLKFKFIIIQVFQNQDKSSCCILNISLLICIVWKDYSCTYAISYLHLMELKFVDSNLATGSFKK